MVSKMIRQAWYDAQQLRPYRATAEILAAITPPGGEWHATSLAGAITRSVMWGGVEVATINPTGRLDDVTEGQIAMGIRATPVLDTALRTILKLARDGGDLTLIATIAETAVAYIEMPAPACRPADEDEADEPPTENDEGPDPDHARDEKLERKRVDAIFAVDDEEPF